jgi:hypothetical protein
MQNLKSDLRSWAWLLALLFVLQAYPAPLMAEETSPQQAQAGSLLWKMQQGYTSASTLNTSV